MHAIAPETFTFGRVPGGAYFNFPQVAHHHAPGAMSFGLRRDGAEADLALNVLELTLRWLGFRGETAPNSSREPRCFVLAYALYQSFRAAFIAQMPSEGGSIARADVVALAQMKLVMSLPVTLAGALMADAHVGYGMPIGGVAAIDNAVIPYAVGVDIGCRVRLTVFDLDSDRLDLMRPVLTQTLDEQTRFGMGCHWKDRPAEHEVMDDPAWDALRLLRDLKHATADQLGTSGSGNHFVEFGAFQPTQVLPGLDRRRTYLALVSHSGSRGLGARTAEHFSKLAMKLHPTLSPTTKFLAWLSLDSEEGQAYWLAMELANRYAAANHDIIHQRITEALRLQPLMMVSNPHNLAWKEDIRLPIGTRVPAIVHRKGATPAGLSPNALTGGDGVLGYIPGTMASPGYLVSGLGNALALDSASHGAGRVMGRKQALDKLSRGAWLEQLEHFGVTLMGAALDEAPDAYKDINAVMDDQTNLVDRLGGFMPQIVRMADDGSVED